MGKPKSSDRVVQRLRIGSKLSELVILLLLIAVTGFSLRAQQPDMPPVLQERLANHQAAHPPSNLYLHLDKTIYSPEETVWLKAYLLRDTTREAKVLYVRIIDEEKTVVANAQFPIYDIRAHGSIALPKYLSEGKYTLFAYTGRMLAVADTNVFVQSIRVRRIPAFRKLEARATVVDTAMLRSGRQAQVKVDIRELGVLASGVRGEYQLLSAGKELKYGSLRSNRFGEAFLNFTYPNLPECESLKVKMVFTQGDDFVELTLNLPHIDSPLLVNCYPEGGKPAPGGRIAVEIADLQGNGIESDFQVLAANRVVMRGRTDKLGWTAINLPPDDGVTYTVETLDGRGRQTVDVPRVSQLAPYSLRVDHGREGTSAVIHNHGAVGSALLVLRAMEKILWDKSVDVVSGDSLTIPIPAADFPKDVLSLMVFDETGMLQAERLFLNKETDDYNIDWTLDKQNYGMKQRVTVKLRVTDAAGDPVVANLSVAASEKIRLDSSTYRNIVQQHIYGVLAHPQRERLFSEKTPRGLDNLLLAGQWRTDGWRYADDRQPGGRPLTLSDVDGAHGVVKSFGKDPITTVNIRSAQSLDFILANFKSRKGKDNDAMFQSAAINVNEDGTFFIPASHLHASKSSQWVMDLYVQPSRPRKGDRYNALTNRYAAQKDAQPIGYKYLVAWKDYDIGYDSLILAQQSLIMERVNTFDSFPLPKKNNFAFDQNNMLEEVVIGAKETITRKLRTRCGDYICSYCGCLNCNFRPTYRPRKGEMYVYAPDQQVPHSLKNYSIIVYLGCGHYRDINHVKNITIPDEFPLPDYESHHTSEQDMRSTVYWNPNIFTDADGTATFSFFTSDVTGEFEVVAQGLVESTLRPLMGTGGFNVVNR